MPEITPQDAGGSNVATFLDLIAFSEGTASGLDRGYGVIVSGIDGHHSFTDYSTHPFDNRPPVVVNHNGLESTAAGRYQLLHRYWSAYKVQLSLPDFSPLSQDKIAIQQLRESHALPYIVTGDVRTAIAKASNLWASFPGNTYEQGGKSLDVLLNKYNELLKVITI